MQKFLWISIIGYLLHITTLTCAFFTPTTLKTLPRQHRIDANFDVRHPKQFQLTSSTNDDCIGSVEKHDSQKSSSSPLQLYHDADTIMEHLCSPAPRSLHVIDHSVQRLHSVLMQRTESYGGNKLDEGDDESFDKLTKKVKEIEEDIGSLSFLVKPGYRIELVYQQMEANNNGIPNDYHLPLVMWDIVINENGDTDDSMTMSVLGMAHDALELVTFSAKLNIPIDQNELDNIAHETEKRLSLTLGTDLVGNQAADAAFLFAQSGISSSTLYDRLTQISYEELCRCGARASFKAKHVIHMVEKLAAAGVRIHPHDDNNNDDTVHSSSMMAKIAKKAALLLEQKGFGFDRKKENEASIVRSLLSKKFDLFSDRVPLWLWRFSSKQKKVKSTTKSSFDYTTSVSQERRDFKDKSIMHICGDNKEWVNMFSNATKPLVIDVGCGMGLSILGLATLGTEYITTEEDEEKTSKLWNQWNLSECNFLGADLNSQFVGYANGIATRWKIRGENVQFVVASAQDILEKVYYTYPGPVQLIMLQFPTPYRLQIPSKSEEEKMDREYNPQLPSGPGTGFMVSEKLLRTVSNIVSSTKNSHTKGYLLLQSNCEDVAVTMRKMTESITSLSCCIDPQLVPPVTKALEACTYDNQKLPRRTLEWISMGGTRAQGPGWSAESILPRKGSTETELLCTLEGTPIHRCIFHFERKNILEISP